MGKLTTYLIMMSGLMLLFYFTGLLHDTGNSAFLNMLLTPEGFPDADTTPTTAQSIIVLEGIAAAALGIGLWIAGKPELAITAPFAIFMFNLAWDFIYVFNVVSSANPVIAILLFSPVLFVFIMTIVEWWRGRD